MDYQRLVSYIYSYPEGVKGQNVGFAKALVHQGQFKLNISLRGVKTENPEMFGVYMMVHDKGYTLIKLGDCLVKSGQAEYSGIFNPDNISLTEYNFKDICGLAVAREDARFDMMLSMWKDEDVTPDMLVFAGMDAKKQVEAGNVLKERFEKDRQKEIVQAASMTETLEKPDMQEGGRTPESGLIQDTRNIQESSLESESRYKQEDSPESENELQQAHMSENREQVYAKPEKPVMEQAESNMDQFEKLFIRADYVDAFDDDYFYDCMEISPEKLKSLKLKDSTIIDNSFLLHGYYNFRHILFGRVRDNLDNTKYFIGVPGMYCNRERFMASMFGFNNFKKSHRSDYANPYFGYWYQEI